MRIMGHFSASHIFLLVFLQFLVALVGTVVLRYRYCDKVDVALSRVHVTDHVCNSMHRKTPAWIYTAS